MAKVSVTHHDNRGDETVPYGFVYFSDGLRIGYAPGMKGTRAPYGLFQPGSGWATLGERHYALAGEYLKNQGVQGKPHPEGE